MKLNKILIKKFKWIDNLELDLTNKWNIITFVWLNESWKTTILEAIDFFENWIENWNEYMLVSKSNQFDFTWDIEVKIEYLLDENDEKIIKDFCSSKDFILSKDVKKISITKWLNFKNSEFVKQNTNSWDIQLSWKTKWSRSKSDKKLWHDEQLWQDIVSEIKNKLLPKIIYYKDFLFNFPEKIYLEENWSQPKEFIYIIQDILDSLDSSLKIKEHIVDRYNKKWDKGAESALQHTINKTQFFLTTKLKDTWWKLFPWSSNLEVILKVWDDNWACYIEFKLKEGWVNEFNIAERSLWFKWFFSFLLFTELRKNRQDELWETVFLLDEPASNLHSMAQIQLLDIFTQMSEASKIFYTTHSQYLINPKFLAWTYIVKNNNLDYKNEINYLNNADIKAINYKNFVVNHPDQKHYFQPILDTLEYQPSLLENVPNIMITEWKSDYYTFKYINEFILSNKYDKINIYPGGWSWTHLNILQLYLWWWRDFVVILDQDKWWKDWKKLYIKELWNIVEDKIYNLDDILKQRNDDYELEDLFSDEEKLEIVKKYNSQATKYKKSEFNMWIMLLYMEWTPIELSEITKEKFIKIFDFINSSWI